MAEAVLTYVNPKSAERVLDILELVATSSDGMSRSEITSQLGLPDRNLKTSTPFFLANEGNRPIYVPASAIDPATGTVSLNDSRIDPAYASVSEIVSSTSARLPPTKCS